VFTGPADPYGRIGKGSERFVHRLGWKQLRGPIPNGMELHHRCGVHACWNPDHLQLVIHAENLAYRHKTYCKRGHPLSGPTYGSTQGLARGAAVTSERFASARRRPSDQDVRTAALPRIADKIHYVN
jgi:hypothetical protein